MWNVTRFFISFFWALLIIQGLIEHHGVEQIWRKIPTVLYVFLALLFVDSIFVRPIAIYNQRSIDDEYPPKPLGESREWQAFNPIQKLCRCVFYYEGVLSGCSGAVYFMFPSLFLWLFGLASDINPLSSWSLAQFGILVTSFGLYQLNADIDTRWGHIAWWLFLDVVWMIVFVVGITARQGYFNPLTLQGGNFWSHVAFHADSSLAIARAVFLLTLFVRGKPERGAAKKKL